MAIRIKGFGWKRDINDPRDYVPETTKIQEILTLGSTKKLERLDPSNLQKKIDNKKYCTSIENQGDLGSCTANAGVGMYEYMQKKSFNKYFDGSRLFLYKGTRLLMGQEGFGDSGAYIRTTLGAMRLFGIPHEEYWPYTDHPVEFDRMPDPWLWSFAQNYQSIKQFRVDYSSDGDENIHRMKEFITKGFALDFGFAVFSSFTDASDNGGVFPYPSPGEQLEGGHSVLIVGYDDDKVARNARDGNTKTGCFLIRNSWGEEWGDDGFGWIPYEYFRAGPNGDVFADDVWTIVQSEWMETGEFF
ncbi:MAG: C1 family peptidase [Candidatus Nitrosocosmicus sp.]